MNTNEYAGIPERHYARILRFLSSAGLILLVGGFIVYSLGLLPATVSPEEATRLWHHSAAEYLEESGHGTGWSWIPELGHGDVVAFATLAILAGISIPALILLCVVFFKERDRVYLIIALLQAAVLLIAASGIFTG